MTKTIPVISGREWWIDDRPHSFRYHTHKNFQRFTARSAPDLSPFPQSEIHVAEVVSSVQLDDLKKLIKALDVAKHKICCIDAGHHKNGRCDICKAAKGVNEALTTFREKYSALLGEK